MSGWDGTNYNIVANRYQQMFIQGYLDVSGRTIIRNGDLSLNNGNLFVGGNATVNGNLFINRDLSLNNGNLYVGYDSSMNGNLSIGKDLTIAGRLNVKNFTSQNIINTTTNNYQLIVSEDLSLNGRMYVKGNVMIGSGNEPYYTLDVSSASTQPFRVGVGATNALVVNSAGQVGIGTTNPQNALDVSGNMSCNGNVSLLVPITVSTGSPVVTTVGNYTILKFTGTSTIIPSINTKIGYIVVGGGGGGGCQRNVTNAGGCGGGGGGISYSNISTGVTLTAGATYTITVGAGGSGATVSPSNGATGGASSIAGSGITTITANGGTGGYVNSVATPGGLATGGNNNNQGGYGGANNNASTTATMATSSNTSGAIGGDGAIFTISETNTSYGFGAGGGGCIASNVYGGAAGNYNSGASVTVSTAGKGGYYGSGGQGGSNFTNGNGGVADANTGAGGGGTSGNVNNTQNGGAGGSGVVYIFYYSGAINTSAINATGITSTSMNISGYATIGNSSGAAFGIGTASPNAILHINCGSSTLASNQPDTNAYSYHGLLFQSPSKGGTSPYSMAMGVDYTNGIGYINCAGNSALQPLVLQSRGGNVGIGITNPGAPLHVYQTSSQTTLLVSGKSGGIASGSWPSGWDGGIHTVDIKCSSIYAGTTTYTSDIRLKTNIEPYKRSLYEVMKLRPVSFIWKDSPAKGRHYGFIAQEIEEIIPEIILEDGDGFKSIKEGIVPILVNSVKEQQNIIETLQTENQELKNQIQTILARLDKLEN